MTQTHARVLETRKGELRETRWVQNALPPTAGQIVCRPTITALTANNVTYAVLADQYGYWKYFPAEEGWGRVPVWGYATVSESHHPEVSVGQRLYGYWPIADAVLLTVGDIQGKKIAEGSSHRHGLPQVYNDYFQVGLASDADAQREAFRAIFDPLAGTAYGLAHHVIGMGEKAPRRIIVTSASSKTAFSFAHCLKEFDPSFTVLGLTSSRNVDVTRGMGLYDDVVAYDAISTLPAEAHALVIDIAGSGPVAADLFAHLGGALTDHVLVGASHPEADRHDMKSSNGRSRVFFMPGYLQAQLDAGDQDFMRDIAAASVRVAAHASGWMSLVKASTPDDIDHLWRRVVNGDLKPDEGGIIAVGE